MVVDSIDIIKINESRHLEWRRLYQSYAEFYKTSLSDNTAKIVWQWIIKGHIRALAAQDNLGALVGIAHWQKILRPLHGTSIAYLHDLYVAPETRGGGVGEKLIIAASADAHKEGYKTMRWATAADNHKAMRLYDRIADKTSWMIYDRQLGD